MYVLVPFSHNPLCIMTRQLVMVLLDLGVFLVRKRSSLSKRFLLKPKPMCVRARKG